jgi:hypothetical protein
MDYWHEIIKYDHFIGERKHRGKDHGTFSEQTSTFLLIYLSFGTDYSTGIAEYFWELWYSEQKKLDFPHVLMEPSKISSILKRMKEDKFVIIWKEGSEGAGLRKYYKINPQIFQSPIRDSATYIMHDGSSLDIPIEKINKFIEWHALKEEGATQKQRERQLRQERHNRADDIFKGLFQLISIRYGDFLSFIAAEARKWRLETDTNQLPALDTQILGYINEFDLRRRYFPKNHPAKKYF